jgi:hypothetical protein
MCLFNYPETSHLDDFTQEKRDTTGLTRFLDSLWNDPTKRGKLMARKASIRLPGTSEDAFPTLFAFLRSHRCLLYTLVLESSWIGRKGWDDASMVRWLEDLGLYAVYIVLSGSYVKPWKRFVERDAYDRVLCQLVLFDKNDTWHLNYEGSPKAEERLSLLHENAVQMYSALESEGLA